MSDTTVLNPQARLQWFRNFTQGAVSDARLTFVNAVCFIFSQ
jgi:hypothetical protein